MLNADNILKPVPDGRLAFWFHNGVIVRSLEELANVLDSLDPAVFKYHVNHDKNDVCAWIEGVFCDDVLVEVLKCELNQKRAAEKIRRHIGFLKQPIAPPKAPRPKSRAKAPKKKAAAKPAGKRRR